MKSLFKRVGLAVMTLLMSLPTMAFAQNLVTVPDTDLSKSEIIDFLFGPIVSGGGSANPLGGIVGVFNGVVLLVGGIIVAYTYLAGTLATAHEGEVLGKRWSSLWLPLRLTLGSALLIPAPGLGGFCVMQSVVVWMALQGIGFADKMWDTFNQDPLGGGIYAPADTTQQAALLTRDLLLAQVCLASIGQSNQIDKDAFAQAITGKNGKFAAGSPTSSTDSEGISYDLALGDSSNEDNSDACGHIKYEMPPNPASSQGQSQLTSTQNSLAGNLSIMNQANQISYNIAQHQWTQTVSLYNSLQGLAQQIVDNSIDASGVQQKLDPIIQNYANDLKTFGASQYKQLYQNTTGTEGSGNPQGWITAGAYYMQISRLMNAVTSASGNYATVVPPPAQGKVNVEKSNQKKIEIDCGWWASSACKLYAHSIVNNSLRAVNLMSKVSSMRGLPGPQIGGENNNSPGIATNFVSHLSKEIAFVMTRTSGAVMNNGTANADTDPVVFAQNMGNSIVSVAWTTFWVTTAATLLIGAPLVGFTAAGNLIGTMGMLLFKIISAAGVTLSVILPMLPFMIWIGAVLGWVVLLVEATVGAPLLCLSIIAPDGDGIVGRAGQGYMMILSLTLKPVLMIFGLIASIVLMKPIGHLVNIMFFQAFNVAVGQSGSSGPGITNMIAGMFLYAAVMLGLVKKIFDLIHVIPDTVLRWIGAPGGQELGSGARAGADADRQAVGAIGTAIGAGSSAASALRGFGETGKKVRDDKKQQAKDKIARGEREDKERKDQGNEEQKNREARKNQALMGGSFAAIEEASKKVMNGYMGGAQEFGSESKDGKESFIPSKVDGMDAMKLPDGIPSQINGKDVPKAPPSSATWAQKRGYLDGIKQLAERSGSVADAQQAKAALDKFDNASMDKVKEHAQKFGDSSFNASDARIMAAAENRDSMFQARTQGFNQKAQADQNQANEYIKQAVGMDEGIAERAQQAGGIEKLMGSINPDDASNSKAEQLLASAKKSMDSARSNDGLAFAASQGKFESDSGYQSPLRASMPIDDNDTVKSDSDKLTK